MEKKERLDTVFSRALDSSISQINESDIDECFGDLKAKFGNKIQKQVVNMLGKTQKDYEVSNK